MGQVSSQRHMVYTIYMKKKLALGFSLILAIIIVVFAYFATVTPAAKDAVISANNSGNQIAAVSEQLKSASEQDTDGDGLLNWEEELFGTDPHNTDTDNDGIADKEDARKSAQDKLATLQETAKKSGTTTLETVTDKLAKETFLEYMKLKQSGAPITPQYAAQIATNIIGDGSLDFSVPSFTENQLKSVISYETEDVKRAYGNDIWNILVKNTPTERATQDDEFKIFIQAANTQDEDVLKNLDPIIAGYANTINDLMVMPVPKSAVSAHLDFVTKMNVILISISDMKAYFTDPVRGLSALLNYTNKVKDMSVATKNLQAYFENNNVQFGEEEGGYALMHSI